MIFGCKVWKVNGKSMMPVIPCGSFIFAIKWITIFPIRAGQRIVINHPKYGVIVKTIAIVDKNNLIWSKGENSQSLPIEKLGPVNKQQVLGRVVCIFKPVPS